MRKPVAWLVDVPGMAAAGRLLHGDRGYATFFVPAGAIVGITLDKAPVVRE
jgi:hypothetical protein